MTVLQAVLDFIKDQTALVEEEATLLRSQVGEATTTEKVAAMKVKLGHINGKAELLRELNEVVCDASLAEKLHNAAIAALGASLVGKTP